MNEKLTLGGDAGIRGLISNREWNQIVIRPTVGFRIIPELRVTGAVALFSTYNRWEYNVHEFRMHQDATLRWPQFKWFNLITRFRVEQRWFFYRSLSNTYNTRLRYLAGLQSVDFNWFDMKHPIYFKAIYEGFANVSDEAANEIFINQSRIHVALGQRISPNFRYEIHYISQRSRQFSEEGLQVSQNIFRLRIFHGINRIDENE